MTPATPTTVLVCDDDARIRQALLEILAAQTDLALAALARDGHEAVELAERETPAVAILDVRVPGGGVNTAREILRRSPDTRILAYSAHDDPGAIEEMRQAGAAEYLVKGAPLRELLAAIRRLGRPGAAEDPGADGEGA
jgi:DNA-binding NarL/FixJ family response regulator